MTSMFGVNAMLSDCFVQYVSIIATCIHLGVLEQ